MKSRPSHIQKQTECQSYFFIFTHYPAYSRVSTKQNAKHCLQFSKHCTLSGGSHNSVLFCYQSGKIKITLSLKWELNPQTSRHTPCHCATTGGLSTTKLRQKNIMQPKKCKLFKLYSIFFLISTLATYHFHF